MKLTISELKVYKDLLEKAISDKNMCIACMVEYYWGVSVDNKDFFYYQNKQRKIVSLVASNLKKADPATVDGLIPKFKKNKILWFLAINKCEDHPKMRKYKILDTPVDYEIASNLSTNKIEGIIYNQQQRIETAIKRWPKVFGSRLMFTQRTVPFFLKGSEV